MSQSLVRHNEPLEPDELAFVQKKEQRDVKQYYQFFRVLMFLSFIIPFAGTWYSASDGNANPFSPGKYFAITGILLSISGFATWIAYKRGPAKLHYDITHRTKTIEQTHISRKVYMPQTNTYHFYLNSPNMLSIEVSNTDYHRMKEGDEVNIEYTTSAKLYLGYF